MAETSKAKNLVIIIIWYASNIGVVLSNKYLLSSTGFRQPVFLTLCHMISCASCSLILSSTGHFPIRRVRGRPQLLKVVLLAALFCTTVVLGNVALKFIPVSFHQMIGATTPFFTAVFARVMQGRREHALTYSALIPVVLGVIISSGGEPLFNVVGFTAALLATSGRALKTVVQAMIMSAPEDKLDPMSLLTYMSCISIFLLVPTTLLVEPSAISRAFVLGHQSYVFIAWLLVNMALAYLVNLFGFMVTHHTGALTLQVLGNGKGVVAAVVSVLIFHNPVTLRGCLGYAVTIIGVYLYSEARSRFTKKAHLPVVLKHAQGHHAAGASSPGRNKE